MISENSTLWPFGTPRCALALGLVVGLGACSVPVRAIGLVSQGELGAMITSTGGRSRPIDPTGEGAPLRWLDGELVEVEGELRKGAIVVDRWKVVEGTHGLPVWVGRVVADPRGAALYDVTNEVTLGLDREAARELSGFVGELVLVEGFAEGGLGLHVMSWRLLTGQGGG